ncbi:MAG: ABC transporter substrate-binding protein [Chloroflexota bacterium]
MTRFSITLSFVVALFLTTACQSGSLFAPAPTSASPPAVTRPPVTPSPAPIRPATPRPDLPSGGAVILGLVSRPDSLNPITADNSTVRELTPLLYDSLLRVDPQSARLAPALAQRWDYRADGRQVTFHLPPNLKWSDGRALTAADIADSLAATGHPALQAFSRLDAPDDNTLTLTLAAIDCAAVTNLALLPLLPAREITAATPVGSGPCVVAGQSERSLTLVRNRNYWGNRPRLDEVTVRFLNPDEITVALSEGQFDVVGPLQPLPPGLEMSGFTGLTYPAAQMVYLAVNENPKNGDPLPPEVRQALILAPDRAAILAEALAGDGQLLAGPLLPGHWAANPNLTLPAYDPETARTRLAQAGLQDSDGDGWLDLNGRRLELDIRLNGRNELHQNLGWLLSSYYREVGLLARAEGVAFDSVVDDLFTHDFQLAIFSWPILPDPDQRLYWHSTENTVGLGLNFTSYRNPGLDEALDEAVAVPGCRPEARAEVYEQVQAVLARARPVDFLLAPNRHVLVGARLRGLEPGPFAPFTWNINDWYVEEAGSR